MGSGGWEFNKIVSTLQTVTIIKTRTDAELWTTGACGDVETDGSVEFESDPGIEREH